MTGRSPDVVWHRSSVAREDRPSAGATIWFTGLPASGKSTLAHAVEVGLVRAGRHAYVLDGDNLRHGLNGDLGFSPLARDENVRRAAEVAKILADAGVVALVALVSPYREARDRARAIHAAAGLPFHEVWVSTPLEECERRDPKGLYARARKGLIEGMTGVNDPYEPPESPELEVLPGEETLDDAVARVLGLLAGPASARAASSPRRTA